MKRSITHYEIILRLLHFLNPSSTIRIHDADQAPANNNPAKELSGCNPSPKCHRKAAGAFICQSSFGYLPFVVMGVRGVPSGKIPLSTIEPNKLSVPLFAANMCMLKIAHTLKPKITRLDKIFAIVLKGDQWNGLYVRF